MLQPGIPELRDLAGAEVEEYYALDEPAPVSYTWGRERDSGDSDAGTSLLWAERLRRLDPGADEVAHYGLSNGWLDDKPAVIVGALTQNGGRVITVGALFDLETQESLTDWLAELTDLTPVWPERIAGVEFAAREHSDGRRTLFVINHTRERTVTDFPNTSSAHRWRDLVTGSFVTGALELKPYDAALLTQSSVQTRPIPASDSDTDPVPAFVSV